MPRSSATAPGPVLLQARTDFQRAPRQATELSPLALTDDEILDCGGSGDCRQTPTTCTGRVSWLTNPGKCLDVTSGVATNGNLIQLWDCQQGQPNQQLILPSGGSGLVRWAANPNKCIDVQDGKANNGNPIQLWDCNPQQPNQQFVVPTGTSGVLRWGTKCLDVTDGSTANGNRIQLWDCSADSSPNKNQLFTKPCAPSSPPPPPSSTVAPNPTLAPAPAPVLAPTPAPAPVPAGSWGWQPSGQVVGSGWCQGEVPAKGWSLRTTCGSLRIKVLTYNLFWWNLFGQRGGNGNSAGRLIAAANRPDVYDFMGFQECDDVNRVLRDSGLTGTHAAFSPGRAVAVAYRTAAWELLESGQEDVAEDQKSQYYGRRSATWGRFRHRQTGRGVLFMSHHGPLQVGSGGQCGGESTAYNLVRLAARKAAKGDAVVLVGDFNSGTGSSTLRVLDAQLYRTTSGSAFGGIDLVYSNCVDAVVSSRNLGNGGSDHDAIDAVLRV